MLDAVKVLDTPYQTPVVSLLKIVKLTHSNGCLVLHLALKYRVKT